MADQEGYPPEYPEIDEAGKEGDEDEEKGEDAAISSKFAKKVVNELYERYNTLRERKSAYKDLVIFLIYVSLNLSILYLQRDATNAYAVVSTIRSTNLIPEVEESTSVQYIYDWLHGTLDDHWVDAKCGDDKCEVPFEFAFYGRFGCKPDCGSFEQDQQVTPVQIDLYYDFKHPSGSTPATSLMQDASWNLCPTPDSDLFESLSADEGETLDTTYISGCYWSEEDEKKNGVFNKLSGHSQTIITDVPDGEWMVYFRGDNFNKVKGAVRDRQKVVDHATDLKVNHLAKAVSVFELRTEWEVLNKSLLDMSKTEVDILIDAANDIYSIERENLLQSNASGEINSTVYDEKLAQLNESLTVTLEAVRGDFKDSNGYYSKCLSWKERNETGALPVLGGNVMIPNPSTEEGADPLVPSADIYCGYSNTAGDYNADVVCIASNKPAVKMLWEYEAIQVGEKYDTSFHDSIDPLYADKCPSATKCVNVNRTLDAYCAWAEENIMAYVGDIKTELLGMRTEMTTSSSELYNAIMDVYEETNIALNYEISQSNGKNMEDQATVAASYVVDVLMDYYMETSDMEKMGNLSDYNFANWDWPLFGNATKMTSYTRMSGAISTRVTEFVEELPANEAATYHYGMTEEALIAAIRENDANSTAYTLVDWMDKFTFGRDAYKTCDMYNRAQEYLGVCVDYSQMQELANLDGGKYKPDQKETACNKLCYCPAEQGCEPTSGVSVCACYQCGMDQDYMAEILSPPPGEDGFRRRLLQDSVESTYQQLLTEISSLSQQQTALSASVIAVSDEQKRQNEAAEAHHADTTLKDTITNGFDDLQASYDTLQTQMDELLAKQNEALASQAAAAASAQKMLAMQQQALDQQAMINRAVEKQLKEIEKAKNSGKIDPDQEQQFRFQAELEQDLANKDGFLANLACDLKPRSHEFELHRYTRVVQDEARVRLLGINNRIVAGMLMYSTRYELGNCTNNRFSHIEQECIQGQDPGHPFGVDPVFKVGTTLYNNDLNTQVDLRASNPKPPPVTAYYNCSCLQNPTYWETQYSSNGKKMDGVEPKETYCRELYSEKLEPYGFAPMDISDEYKNGYPVFFDINLSHDRAQEFYHYVEEGHFIEESETKDIKVHLVTYNAELRTFANIQILFEFALSGKIEISYSIQPVRVELYEESGDYVRLVFEIILTIGSIVALALELLELFESQQKYGTVKAYFRSPWNYVDLTSITLQIACMCFWWMYVLTAINFDISPKVGGRYDVYHQVESSPARFLALHGEFITIPGVDEEPPTTMCSPKITRGEGFRQLGSMLTEMEAIGVALSQYMTLSGINIILMIARSLKLMDFQPRLGIVTKTLTLAASDILHFLVVFGVVFMGYVMMGTLVFGYKIEAFSTLMRSLTTCFETLLGEIGWNADLMDLPGLENAAGFVYFWSYQILVFMILLNFLVAIIVDAYAEIKEEAQESVSVPAEVLPMLKEMWRTRTMSKYFYTKHIPEERIRKSLKVLAGRGDEESDSEESIEFDLNPEKVLKVGDEEIDKDTLRRVLQHCVAYAEERSGVYDLNKAGETGGKTGLFGCFGGKGGANGGPPLFTAQDINGAVDMLMSQHGENKSKEEEEEDEEEEDADVKELMEKMQELVKGQDDLMRGQRKLEELEERLLKVIEMPPPDQHTE